MKILLNDQTILVTGADGFIGTHLTEDMVKEGTKVKKSKYKKRNQTLFIRHCEVLMTMARPPFCHCEEVASTDVAISGAKDIGKKERLPRFARNDRKKTFSTACEDMTTFILTSRSPLGVTP